MHLSFVVVPVQCDPDVSCSCPIAGEFVMFLERVFEMLGVFLANVFHPKVVHNQCELYRPCVVLPKARYQFALSVAMFVQTFFEEFVGQQSCLWEAVHPLIGSDVDAAIFGGFLSEFVLVDDFIRYVA